MKNVIFIIIITLIYSLIEHGCTQSNKCGIQKFRCRNGQCIASDLLCDGRANCKDQSDETLEECSKPEIICPEFAFRCEYGACVDGDATCNGVPDCIDNSDETLSKCISSSHNVSTSCLKNEFKCNSGQCISESSLCDGIADCTDNSDETFIQCGSISCPQLFFRCSYGACIDSSLKCNGVTNCVDDSDEDPKLCKGTTPTVVPVVPVLPTFTTTTENSRPVSPTLTSVTCTVPKQPTKGYRKLCKLETTNGASLCNYVDVPQGTKIKPGEHLLYSCEPGYQLKDGNNQVYCSLDGRFLNIPKCTEIRCKGLDSRTTSATCRYYNDPVPCHESVLPHTDASLKCHTGYRPDGSLLTSSNPICNINGQWYPDPIQCIPECGVQQSKENVKPLIVNGVQANVTEFPWHATLYEMDVNGTKEFQCGATIIHERFLITAAHCVYDEGSKSIVDPSRYYIATGNIFKDYDYVGHDKRVVKKAKVKNIYIRCEYRGREGNYAEDIAIIEITQPFILTTLLLPICLDSTKTLKFDVGHNGKVAGFGKTSLGPSSFVLQTITVPRVQDWECRSKSEGYQTSKFLTSDKFCAGYTNGSAICEGDSGGGLAFQPSKGGLWYLAGVVSLSLNTKDEGGTQTCDSTTYTIFTTVSQHMTWIQDVLQRVQTNKPLYQCFKQN